MSSSSKHKNRSQYSSHTGIPVGIFYYHAAKDRNTRETRNINKALDLLYGEELNGKKESEEDANRED